MGDDANLQLISSSLNSQSTLEWMFASQSGDTLNSVGNGVRSTTTYSVA